MAATLTRFVILPPHACIALALWIVHTYAFKLRDVTTYIGIESPEKQCGKTTLLAVLNELVNRAVAASNVSPPAFFRVIEDLSPTLLIDEGDTFLKGNDQLRGILNAGYKQKTAFVLRAGPAAPYEWNRRVIWGSRLVIWTISLDKRDLRWSHRLMARALRIERPGGRYHVTARGNERKPIFHDHTDRFHFLELLSELGERFGLRVHAFVLMDNHYHLLLETPEANLSRAMHWLNAGYCVWFNRRHRRHGHLLQGRFGGFLVEDDGGWQELARYVHLNPVWGRGQWQGSGAVGSHPHY